MTETPLCHRRSQHRGGGTILFKAPIYAKKSEDEEERVWRC